MKFLVGIRIAILFIWRHFYINQPGVDTASLVKDLSRTFYELSWLLLAIHGSTSSDTLCRGRLQVFPALVKQGSLSMDMLRYHFNSSWYLYKESNCTESARPDYQRQGHCEQRLLTLQSGSKQRLLTYRQLCACWLHKFAWRPFHRKLNSALRM